MYFFLLNSIFMNVSFYSCNYLELQEMLIIFHSKQKASKATRIEHLAHIQSSIISNAKICVGCERERERERWQDKPWCNRTDYKEACLHTKRLEKLLQVSKPTDYNC